MFAGLDGLTALKVLELTFSPMTLGFLFVGTIGGILFGAVPGLTGAMLIVLSLPLTFYMTPVNALNYLIAIYVGAISGGLITATLFRMPGTPSSVVTTFDGYPMAAKGQPGKALGIGITSSLVGGIIAFAFLFTITGPLALLATRFGHFEYFTLVLMAMVLIASVSQGSMILGLVSGLFGMLVSMPGYDNSSGQLRLSFGFHSLEGGLDLFPVLIGMFVVSEILAGIVRPKGAGSAISLAGQRFMMSLGELRSSAVNMLRSSIIGTWIGILPGIGANIASILAYTTARNVSHTPEKFGTGMSEGIIASESANNATVGGALVPLFAMGIPGTVIDAILIGAFTIHGIMPGPLLFTGDASLVYSLMIGYLVANLMMFAIMMGTTRYIVRLIDVPKDILLPIIALSCVIGIYALNHRFFEIYLALSFGVIGYVLTLAKVPLPPFIIGFILAPIAEENLRSGLTASHGSLLPMVTRPISLLFLLISIAFLFLPVLQSRLEKRRQRQRSA